MIKTILLTAIFLVVCYLSINAQTPNTSPLPTGETIIGNHLHAGAGNEVWTDAPSLYFNYRGSGGTTYFWNLGGGSGKPIMTLLSNGNVGINKLNPLEKLDLVGSALIGDNNVNSNTTKLFLRNNAGKTWAISSGANMISENIFSIYNWTDNSTTPFFRINDTGEVSITSTRASTSSTNGALVVAGDIGTGGRIFSQLGTGSIFSTKYYTGNYGTVLYMSNDVGQNQKAIRLKTAYSGIGTPGYANFSIDRSTNAQPYNADPSALSYTESLVIDGNNGNIGIGTKNPAYKLDVLGTIRAKEVLVNLDGGADFVFEKGYKLLPIEHVASYVQENKHLPDIPSADEMVKNGVSMGDMQVKLLQKVEELTLYAIQQNKEIVEQRKDRKELEVKLAKQESQYNALLEKVEILTKQIEKK